MIFIQITQLGCVIYELSFIGFLSMSLFESVFRIGFETVQRITMKMQATFDIKKRKGIEKYSEI